MKKNIFLIFMCCSLLCVSACGQLDSLKAQMKNNIADIAEEISETENKEEKSEPENSICIGVTEFDTFNPLTTASQTVREAMQLVYEPLFEADENGGAAPVLASEYNVSADGLTYVIKMKSGVSWHDGKGFDAYDAAYTIKQLLNIPTQYSEQLSEVSDFRAVSGDTLRITLKRPVCGFVLLLNFPIVKYNSDMTADKEYKPVGTGAFAYTGKIASDKYEFGAFENYHNGRAKLDRAYVQILPDSEKYMSSFEVSETDIITGLSADLTSYTPKGGNKIYEYVSNRLTYVGFNTENTVLSGADTRRGIGELINKSDIVSSVIYSRGVGVNVPINPQSRLYYDTDTDLSGSRERALELFGNDGWGEGTDGYLVRNTEKRRESFKITILADSDDEIMTETAKRIKSQCERCGIKASVNAVSHDEYSRNVSERDFDIYIGEADLGANGDISPLILSEENPFGYSSEDADMLSVQAGMTGDDETLKEIYKSIGALVTEEAPFVPLYYSKDSVAVSGKIIDGVSPVIGRAYRNAFLWRVM